MMRFSMLRLLAACVLLGTTLTLPLAAQVVQPSREIQQRLIHAVVQDQIQTVRDLLRQGGDPNARVAPDAEDVWAIKNTNDDDPAPPLIVLACRFGSIEGPRIIEALLDKGADVNCADHNGVTPLMAASELGMGSVSLLLEHGAKVNARDREGKTPLMYAMNNRGLNAVALLLEKGAKIDAADSVGWTPLMVAIRRAVYDPIRLVGDDLTAKAREETERYLELIRFLIEHKADVSHKAKAGETPLSLAVAQRQTEVTRLLRKAGARR